MQNIRQINTLEYTSYPQYGNTQTNTGNDFDTVFAAETTIYAVPETNIAQFNATGSVQSGQSNAAPTELGAIFKRASEEYGISESLLIAVAKTESNFNANATSGAGAMGIMQLMPSTASYLGVTNAYDAESNIMGGARYLSELLTKYNSDTTLALAAYNAGPGNVDKYNGVPPFAETQNYIRKIYGYMNSNVDISTVSTAAQASGASPVTIINATPADQTKANSITTIYAVASMDATNTTKLYI